MISFDDTYNVIYNYIDSQMCSHIFVGFRAIGFNLLFSFWAMVLINGSFSWVTLDVRILCYLTQPGLVAE
jgi:hypothetical protein